MKKLFLPLAVLAIFFLVSCQPAVKEEAAMEPIPASDFDVIIVRHPVTDYAAWRPHYDAHDSVRTAYGMTTMTVARGVDNPNMVLVANRVSDIQKARDFAAMPELKTVMDSAGVSGPPTIQFMHSVRFDTTTNNTRDRVMVVTRVKDYDTFLKVYDNEGRKVRMEHGLVDRALGRDIDDPNVVYLVFAVTDKEKAMARFQSEDLKKIMMESGVEGQPDFFWYTVEN